MAQFLKDDVQARIADAALSVFSEKGYLGATVAEIARVAGTSTGNVYRYYENKDVLFDDVVPRSLVATFRARLRARAVAARGMRDLSRLDATSPYVLASSALMALTLAHRREVVIVLGRARGTRYEGLAAEVVTELVELALDHAASLTPPPVVTPTMRFTLRCIYEGFVATEVAILATYTDDDDARAAIDDYVRYHLSGLERFFR